MKSLTFNILHAVIALTLVQIPVHAADPGAGPAVNIVFIGDSITFGAGIAEPSKQAPPAVCVNTLQKQLQNPSVYFSNQGHCGISTAGFLPMGQQFEAAVAAAKQLNADHAGQLVFSIMLGTNDSCNNCHMLDSTYHDNYKRIIDQLLADFPNSKILINYPIWYSPNTHNGADYEGESAANRLKSYFPKIDTLVAEYQAPEACCSCWPR